MNALVRKGSLKGRNMSEQADKHAPTNPLIAAQLIVSSNEVTLNSGYCHCFEYTRIGNYLLA